MFNVQKKLLSLVVLVSSNVIMISCNKYKGDFYIINTYYTTNPLCPKYIFHKGRKLTIENIRKYRNGKLSRYMGCASEGLYTDDFEKEGNYSIEDEDVKNLSVYREGNKILLFSKNYKIINSNRDSLFLEPDKENKYLILVGNVPIR